MKKIMVLSSLFIFSLQAEVRILERVKDCLDTFVNKMVEKKAKEVALGAINSDWISYEFYLVREMDDFEQLPEDQRVHPYSQTYPGVLIYRYLENRQNLQSRTQEEIKTYSCSSEDEIALPGEMEFYSTPLWGSSITQEVQLQATEKVKERLYKNKDLNAKLVGALEKEEAAYVKERDGLWKILGQNADRVALLNYSIKHFQEFRERMQKEEEV